MNVAHVEATADAITPVPDGVGRSSIVSLIKNNLTAGKHQLGSSLLQLP
ncbi:MAG: hypothetical protein HRT76_14245 [Halieaceae bacterium]|nr:hypothetical protein [Halieaceae bacterium]